MKVNAAVINGLKYHESPKGEEMRKHISERYTREYLRLDI